MNDATESDSTMSESTSESPEDLGNTVDGSSAGDGRGNRDAGDESADAAPTSTSAAAAPEEQSGSSPRTRAEQAEVYQTPEQPDHAIGGSEGTADGM